MQLVNVLGDQQMEFAALFESHQRFVAFVGCHFRPDLTRSSPGPVASADLGVRNVDVDV